MAGSAKESQEHHWDDARVALGDVAQLLQANPELSPDDMRTLLREQVDNYDEIPEPVREAVEGLSVEERRIVMDFSTVLTENHFYLENATGVMNWF